MLKFIINFRSSTLPSPANLSRWGKGAHHPCRLCSNKNATISHIMNFCPWVRRQNELGFEDRYTWHHNCVLTVLIKNIATAIKSRSNDTTTTPSKCICFVKSGWRTKGPQAQPQRFGLLAKSHDRKLCFDLPESVGKANSFVMPHNIVLSPLKVDLLIISEKLKHVVFCELTCPNEENLTKWQKIKQKKYASLLVSLNSG